MQKKKITKRMRKAIKGPNEMVKACMKKGKSLLIGGDKYIGANPVYRDMNTVHGGLPNFVKVRAGVPFVRA